MPPTQNYYINFVDGLNNNTSTTTTTEAPPEGDDIKFIIVPLVVIVLVMILSIMVYCLAKRRREIKLRRNILKLYEFDSNEQEWEPLASNEYPCYGNDFITTTIL